MLILAMVSLPFSSRAISSSAGAIILHGPHHSAQKSTSTGPAALSTSVSNDASLTWMVWEWVVVAAAAVIPVFPRMSRPGGSAGNYVWYLFGCRIPLCRRGAKQNARGEPSPVNLGSRLHRRQGEGFSHAHPTCRPESPSAAALRSIAGNSEFSCPDKGLSEPTDRRS